MQSNLYENNFDQFTKILIRKKAQQLLGKKGFTCSDRNDIEQELTLKLFKSRGAFDPGQAHWNVFVTTVVERCAANLLRNKQAKKRDHQRICSLNVVISKKKKRVIELGDMIDSQAQDARLGQKRRSDLDRAQLFGDLNEIIAGLSPELRELAEAMKVDSVSKISRDRGINRSKLNYRVRQLRQQFEDAGLADYL